jgi:hypothetical protein
MTQILEQKRERVIVTTRMKADQRGKRGKRKVENKVQSARIVEFKFQTLLF